MRYIFSICFFFLSSFALLGQSDTKSGISLLLTTNTIKVSELEQVPSAINLAAVTQKIGYPIAASAQGIQGEVLMKVLVDEKGHYQRHIITNKVNPLLSNIVEAHIAELRFKPAIYKGNPISYWVNIPFNFKLPNAPVVEETKKVKEKKRKKAGK